MLSGCRTVNSYCTSLVMGIGQVLTRKTDRESIALLKKALEQSHHCCLVCEKRVSDHRGVPICKSCHILSIYAKDYNDTFLCKCQNYQLTSDPSQHTCKYFDGAWTKSLSHEEPNWTDPTKLVQNELKKQKCENVCDEQTEYELQTEQFVMSLPPEIISMIFQNLDEPSLLSSSKVCRKWENLVKTVYPDRQWKIMVLQRWPLYNQIGIEPGISWLSVYFKMFNSVPCITCLMNSTGQSKLPEPNFDENEHDGICSRIKRLDQEFTSIQANQLKGIQVVPLDDKKYDWMTRISISQIDMGLTPSPYDGGVFYVNFKFPVNYPFQPPKVRFLTKIFHPDISRHGDLVVLDLIEPRFWSPGHTIRSLLLSIINLLIRPHLKSNVEPLIKKMYVQDRTAFTTIARQWTVEYAMNFEKP